MAKRGGSKATPPAAALKAPERTAASAWADYWKAIRSRNYEEARAFGAEYVGLLGDIDAEHAVGTVNAYVDLSSFTYSEGQAVVQGYLRRLIELASQSSQFALPFWALADEFTHFAPRYAEEDAPAAALALERGLEAYRTPEFAAALAYSGTALPRSRKDEVVRAGLELAPGNASLLLALSHVQRIDDNLAGMRETLLRIPAGEISYDRQITAPALAWASAYVDPAAELPALNVAETPSNEMEFLRLLILLRADVSAPVWHRLIWRLSKQGSGPISLRTNATTGSEEIYGNDGFRPETVWPAHVSFIKAVMSREAAGLPQGVAAALQAWLLLTEAEAEGKDDEVERITGHLFASRDANRFADAVNAQFGWGVERICSRLRASIDLTLEAAADLDLREDLWVEQDEFDGASEALLACVGAYVCELADYSVNEWTLEALQRIYNCWREVILSRGLYSLALDCMDDSGEGLERSFDRALFRQRRNKGSDRAEAKKLYAEYLEKHPGSAGALFNLALAIHPDDQHAAADLEWVKSAVDAQRATAQDDLYDKAAKQVADKLQKLQEREDFCRAARSRWPQIHPQGRQLLVTLTHIQAFRGFDHLGQLAGMDADWAEKHYKKLVRLGMVQEVDGGLFQINPHIRPLLVEEDSHRVVGRIIRASGEEAVKQVFNSGLEFTIYQAIAEICPNHLVFPNMALQAIMRYERMKELVDQKHFDYYLKASVDLAVVSSTSYLPLMCFEVDSIYHDTEEQQTRDERKDRLFSVSGVPFMRLRVRGKPSPNVIRGQIAQQVEMLVRGLKDRPWVGADDAKSFLLEMAAGVAAKPH